MWKCKFRGARSSRPGRKRPSRRVRLVDLTGLELLDRRLLPAVTATFSAAQGVLTIIGNAHDNTIAVSRKAGGTILVNNGSVTVRGRRATVANTTLIQVFGLGGNDKLSLDETHGALPKANIFGAAGNDTITGGSGNDMLMGGSGNDTLLGKGGNDVLVGGDGDDFIDGGRGNDVALLGAGNDTFVWNPGDGSDTVEGEAGSDTMLFNGSNANEQFNVSANGQRVRFTRDVGNVAMDLNGVEEINVSAMGGADTISVNDLTGTDVARLNLDLSGVAGSGNGDGQADTVIVNGTSAGDTVDVLGAGSNFVVAGPPDFVAVKGSDGSEDSLVINTVGGNDTVSASTLPASVVRLTVDGGAGDDTIVGGSGDDVLEGGDGNDFIDGKQGNDVALLGAGRDTFVWNSGDGSDTVEGQDGSDKMLFNCSNASENIDISAYGSRVRFFRDVGNVTMDLDGVEEVDVNALGGADTITLNDPFATDLDAVNVNLKSTEGSGDRQADAVIVNGTNGDDTIQIQTTGNGSDITVAGLFPLVNISGAEGTNDKLTVNAQGGNDVVDASNLPANLIGLTLSGGAGSDTILGSQGTDLVSGGAGNDMASLGAGDDIFVWNQGDGSDVVDGQAGTDNMLFNGSNTSELIDVSANGQHVRFTRSIANIVMDLAAVETIDFNALGGADIITVNDLTGTDLTQLNVDLSAGAAPGIGDGLADTVVVNGTNGNDGVIVAGDASGISAFGLSAGLNIKGADTALDLLTINTLGGDDVLDASGLSAAAILFAADGGDGDDALIGGAGNDTLNGGAGNDRLTGGAGDDDLIGGPGLDLLDGGPGDNILTPD